MRLMGKYSVSVHYSYAECDTISTVLVILLSTVQCSDCRPISEGRTIRDDSADLGK